MSRRNKGRDGSGGRDGGRGGYSYGAGVGDNATNYAPSVGTPDGRMNEKRGSTQIAGAPRDVALAASNPTSLRGSGNSPSFGARMPVGGIPGTPAVPRVGMPQTRGAGANAGGANQPGGAGGFTGGGAKGGKLWANFRRSGRDPSGERGNEAP